MTTIIRWTNQTYDDYAGRIAAAIWEQSTGNGRDLPNDLRDDHHRNCEAAVANTWHDDISVDDWMTAALARVTGGENV